MKPHVLIIPGWMENSSYWNPLKNQLDPYYNVHNIDLPGFGIPSTEQEQHWTLKKYTSYIYTYLQDKNITHLHGVIGHSMGGLLAVLLLSETEITSAKLVLSNLYLKPSSFMSMAKPFSSLLLPVLQTTKKLPQKLSKHAIKLSALSTIKKYNNIPDALVDAIQQADAETASNLFKELVEFNSSPVLKQKPKTLIIHGKHDKLVSKKECLAFAQRVQAQFIEFPNISHTPQFEQPQLFQSTVVSFLTNETNESYSSELRIRAFKNTVLTE